jgi:hypothetical protein
MDTRFASGWMTSCVASAMNNIAPMPSMTMMNSVCPMFSAADSRSKSRTDQTATVWHCSADSVPSAPDVR